MQTLWPISGASIIGSAHIRKGSPNQDAYGFKNLSGGIQVLALSDGHGGERHLYSDLGSKAAIEAAIESVQDYALNTVANQLPYNEAKLQFDFEGHVSKDIQVRWLQKIQSSPAFEDAMQFGCTLLLCVKFDKVIVFLQLGDGKIAVVYTNGVIYYPIPRDMRYENNETASLAQTLAWAEMKVVTLSNEGDIHAIFLASDGVENAYPEDYYDDAYFYMKLALPHETNNVTLPKLDVQSEGILHEMLNKASQYSKDDTTVVMWHNPENTMQETTVPESLQIWMGAYPNYWLPITCHLDKALNKRIDYALLLIEAIQRDEGVVPQYLSIKQIYLDADRSRLEIIAPGDREPVVIETLYALIMQMLMLPDTQEFLEFGKTLKCDCFSLEPIPDTLRHMKRKLIAMKQTLRYDYLSQQFVCDGKPSAISITASNGHFALFFDSDIYLHQLMPLVGDYDGLIGRVIQHAKYKNIWGMVNLSGHVWQVVGGKRLRIDPGMTLTLIDGITVFIHGIPVKIRIINQ